MKRFDSFGEYMFSLLFGPLKRTRRAVNQFAIFFRVVGREFDDLKEAAFRVRDEANVASASAVMLPVHGQDRNMPRLAGETDEGYRTRLSMKGIIASWAGTARGILYVLTALGYEGSRIEPVCFQDPNRWAEFSVHLAVGGSDAVRDLYTVYDEVQKVKEGSSRLAGFQVTFLSQTTEISGSRYCESSSNRKTAKGAGYTLHSPLLLAMWFPIAR